MSLSNYFRHFEFFSKRSSQLKVLYRCHQHSDTGDVDMEEKNCVFSVLIPWRTLCALQRFAITFRGEKYGKNISFLWHPSSIKSLLCGNVKRHWYNYAGEKTKVSKFRENHKPRKIIIEG
jgi:hypothetical protein